VAAPERLRGVGSRAIGYNHAGMRITKPTCQAMSLFWLAAIGPTSAAAAADWPMFRGNAAHHGVAVAPERMAARPRLVWTFESGGDPVESSAAIGLGLAFIGTAGGEIVALDLTSGKPRLRFRIPSDGGIRSSPALWGRRLYFGDDAGVFHALNVDLDRRELTEAWSQKTEGEILSSATVAGEHVLFGSYDSHLWCLATTDGKVLWKVMTDGQVHATPAVVDGVALTAGCDGQLRAIEISTGREVGRVDMGGYSAASPAAVSAVAYAATFSNHVLAIDWKKGSVLWTFEDSERQFPFYASPAVSGGRVIVAGRDKAVRALSRETGKETWSFQARARIDSSPVICGAVVFVGSHDGDLYMLDLATGQKLWSFTAGSPITASPAIASGWLVIGSGDGRVFGFDLRAEKEEKTLQAAPEAPREARK